MPIKDYLSLHILWEVLIKIIKVFVVFYIAMILYFAIDWFIENRTGDNKQAQFAITYCSKETKNINSEKFQKKLEKISKLHTDWKVKKIFVSGLVWKKIKEDVYSFFLKKGINREDIILRESGRDLYSGSKQLYNFNKDHGWYPNIWIIWVENFFKITRMKFALKEAGFTYVWWVKSNYYRIWDVFHLGWEVVYYLSYKYGNMRDLMLFNKKEITNIRLKVQEEIRTSSKEKYIHSKFKMKVAKDEIIYRVSTFIKERIQQIKDNILFIKNLIISIYQSIIDFINAIINSIVSSYNWLVNTFIDSYNWLVNSIIDVIEYIVNVFIAIWDFIVSIYTGFFEWIESIQKFLDENSWKY